MNYIINQFLIYLTNNWPSILTWVTLIIILILAKYFFKKWIIKNRNQVTIKSINNENDINEILLKLQLNCTLLDNLIESTTNKLIILDENNNKITEELTYQLSTKKQKRA